MAGRDPRGTVPLFWATDVEGLRLYFATNKEALSEHADRVREFPGEPCPPYLPCFATMMMKIPFFFPSAHDAYV